MRSYVKVRYSKEKWLHPLSDINFVYLSRHPSPPLIRRPHQNRSVLAAVAVSAATRTCRSGKLTDVIAYWCNALYGNRVKVTSVGSTPGRGR